MVLKNWICCPLVFFSRPVNASGGRWQLTETLCSSPLGGDCKKLQEEGVKASRTSSAPYGKRELQDKLLQSDI